MPAFPDDLRKLADEALARTATDPCGPAPDWVDAEDAEQWQAVLARLRAVLVPPPGDLGVRRRAARMTRAGSDDGPGTPDDAKVAARLAGTTPVRELEPLFAELPEDLRAPGVEMRACLLGEFALIGARAGRKRMDAYAGRLLELGHPLARLPETRLDVEHRFGVRVRGLGSVKTLRQLRSRLPELPPSDTARLPGGVPSVWTTTRGRGRSGGRSRKGMGAHPEVRFFALPVPLDPGDFGMSFLERLPLACLQGGGSAVACATTPDDVLNELFSAALYGGVGGRGQGSAYARLYAWESLCALMDLPARVPCLEAVRHTADHRWVRFLAATPWFHHDTADVGFAVLDPSRTRVAVLAATDTGPTAPGA